MATWTISQMERNASDGGVTTVHWRVNATSGEHSASSYGTVGFSPDASADGFVGFDSLDEATVLVWVHGHESIDKDAIEAGLQSQLDALANPTSIAGLAW